MSDQSPADQGTVDLATYRNPPDLDKGRGFLVRSVWFLVNAIFLINPANPSSGLKRAVLKMFGAKIGPGCLFKPGISVKSPWNLEMGANCWIGERSWIDSLAPVKLGNNVCLSQDVYLCCGNHDWTDPAFGKSVKPITIEDGAWIASRAVVLSGVTIAAHSVIAAGAIVSQNTKPYMIYAGNPAVEIKQRIVKKPG